MADSKITALSAISTVDPAADPLVIVDVSDTSMAASGTTKKITSNQILGAGGTATLASATITGDLTVGNGTNANVIFNGNTSVLNIGFGSLRGGSAYGDVRLWTDRFRIYNNAGTQIIKNINGTNGAETWYDGAGGTRMTLDSSGNLSTYGTENSGNLNVTTAAQVCGLRLRQTQNVHPATRNWSIYTNGSAYGVLEFGVGASQFSDTYSTVLIVDGAGNLTPNGNLVPANGKGIDFSATPQPAGMTSELLSDYEEGTFTPVVTGASTAGTASYIVQVGRYTKIGNRVNVDVYVDWNTHTGTGAMRITGLPYQVKSAANYYASVAFGYVSLATLNANNLVCGLANGASTYAEVLQYAVGGGTTGPVSILATGALIFSVSYEV